MIGREQFKAMLNIARGVLVDHDALVDAQRGGEITHAGMDPEPLPRDHPLLQMNNVTFTPRVGSATFITRKMLETAAIAGMKERHKKYQKSECYIYI